MAAVHAEHVLEMAAAEDKDPVEALGADRTDPALGARVRFGAWTGVRITVIPSLRKTSSKTWQNFASRSWTTTGATRACSAAIAEGARRFAPRRCAQRRGAERVQRGRPAGRPGGQPAGAAPRGHRLSLGGVDADTARAAHIVRMWDRGGRWLDPPRSFTFRGSFPLVACRWGWSSPRPLAQTRLVAVKRANSSSSWSWNRRSRTAGCGSIWRWWY